MTLEEGSASVLVLCLARDLKHKRVVCSQNIQVSLKNPEVSQNTRYPRRLFHSLHAHLYLFFAHGKDSEDLTLLPVLGRNKSLKHSLCPES